MFGRHRYTLLGVVQGVGFRPFVLRLARRLGLSGWVQNRGGGVVLEVEGPVGVLEQFRVCLTTEKPLAAQLQDIQYRALPLQGGSGFSIRGSGSLPETLTRLPTDWPPALLPDTAPCADCLAEFNTPGNRRYQYPFISCEQCGPRYSILKHLPYDRCHTSLQAFSLCGACQAEYEDPGARRFHSQTICCPVCGPSLRLLGARWETLANANDALDQAAALLMDGQILAVKAVGGYQLVGNARNAPTVARLRLRKHRPEKALALLYRDLDAVHRDCWVSPGEAKALTGAEAPIVLLERKPQANVCGQVAPDNPLLGVMLPSSPLYYALLSRIDFPVVVTSANPPGAPMVHDDEALMQILGPLADVCLWHDRVILNRVDDSLVREMAGQLTMVRRGRGYGGLFKVPTAMTEPRLAVGGHLKNSLALAYGSQLLLGPYIGDLSHPWMLAEHEKQLQQFARSTDPLPMIICDVHPDYASTHTGERLAREKSLHLARVQHHCAHAYACLLDNTLQAPALAVVWDGTGYGDDGTIWGSEFFYLNNKGHDRVGHFLPFLLPGGNAAAKDTWRSAAGLLYGLDRHLKRLPLQDQVKGSVLQAQLDKKINAPLCSSAGRLFDGVAFLLGLADGNTFEAKAAMALEFAAMQSDDDGMYDFELREGVLDWRPLLESLLVDIDHRLGAPTIARRFHNTLAAMILAQAVAIGEEQVLLTGGCFQNKVLLESAIESLRGASLQPYWHHRIPPGDGGLSAGQLTAQGLGAIS